VPSARLSVVVVEPSALVEDVEDAPAIACASGSLLLFDPLLPELSESLELAT